MHPALAGISLVVFDLDGTLIDSAPDLAVAVDATLAERDLLPAGVDKVRHWVGNGSHKLVERALADALGAAAESLDAGEIDAAHDRFLAYYADAPCERTQLYDGVHECLEAMRERNIACVLVTNKPVAFLPAILEQFTLASFFALTLGGDSLSEKKPHPAPLLHAAEHTGVAPARALMVGDSRHDVQAGKAAGFRTLAVTYGYNHGEPIADSAPDHVTDSLAVLAAD
ncbi:phosphoglycolate phosphatase [Salinisphaera dokdonensis CL-ES53]|uniref:Phosphoglycolate phosphatase n=1 Tax=Salinisphaera dokdonensis CL-ES53 TaxID=1304272 RepID=A0ABV2B2J2_9GAMM